MSRYDKTDEYAVDVDTLRKRNKARAAEAPVKSDPVADMVRMASQFAPVAGQAIGGIAGGIAGSAGGPAGILAGATGGAALGGGIGETVKHAGTAGANWMNQDEDKEIARRRARDDEDAAVHRAVLSMLR